MFRFSGVFIVALLAAGVAGTASADPIGPNTKIVLYDSYGNTGGGEFVGNIVGTPIDLISGTGIDFISFCLEANEYFSPGQELTVSSVSLVAKNGGLSGGNPDPISEETAYLFTQFAEGTLSGYDFLGTGQGRINDANSLQRAFWYLEQELGAYYNWAAMDEDLALARLKALDEGAWVWVNEAKNANWSGYGNVQVLNLTQNGNRAQDQLYYVQSVPEPGSLFLMSTGLLALAGARSRKRRKIPI